MDNTKPQAQADDWTDVEADDWQDTDGAAPQAPVDKDPYGSYLKRHANDSIGQKLKSIAFGDSDSPVVKGTPPMVAPAALLPKVAAMGQAANATRLGRVGMSAAQGGLGEAASGPIDQSLEERANKGLMGLGIGAAAGVGGEILQKGAEMAYKGARKLARFSPGQASAYVENPGAVNAAADLLEDGSAQAAIQRGQSATDAIQGSRKNLRAEGLKKASQLAELIKGKTAKINPSEWGGIDDSLDEAIRAQANPYSSLGVSQKEIEVPLEALQSAKRAAQSQAAFKQGTVYDPVQSARMEDMAIKANKLKQMVEQAGGEGVKPLNDAMQENVLLGKELRAGLKNPQAFTSTASPDRLTKLALSDRAAGGGGLFDYTNQQGAAKVIAQGDVGSGVPSVGIKATGRAGLRASQPVINATEARTPQMALIEALRSLRNE